MATDYVGYIMDNPLILGAIVVVVGGMFLLSKFSKKKKEDLPKGREFLKKEVKSDMKQTLRILAKRMKDTELWQGMIYIGSIKSMSIQPAILSEDKEKHLAIDKVKKVYTMQLYKDTKFLGVPIGKISAYVFGNVFIFIVDSDSILYHRNEDTELFRVALSQKGIRVKNTYEIIRLKQDVFIETHLGVTIVNSQIVQDHMRSINWKILNEEAQGEYLLVPRKLTYLAPTVSGKVEVFDAVNKIEQEAQDRKIKRYTQG